MAYTPEEQRYLEAVRTQEFGSILPDLQAQNWQSKYPDFDWSWPTGRTNPRVVDRTTGQLLQTGAQASKDSIVDKIGGSLPFIGGAAILGGAAGLGPLAGADAASGAAGQTFAGQPIGNSYASAANMTDAPVQWDAPPTGGGMTNSIMNNPYAGGLGGTAGVDLGAAGLGSSGAAAGTSGLGFGSGSLMGDAAAGAAAGAAEGGDIWSTINGLLGPTGINGVTGAGLLGAGINYLTQNRAAGQYKDLANQVAASGNTLAQPQRQPYQQNLSTLVNNPSQYMATDPFAQALTAQYKNNVIPRNVAASGNPASVLDEKGSQFATALAGNYNTQVGQMSGIAGFGFPPSGYTPSAVGAAGAGAIGAQATGVGGLANLFGQNFGQPAQGTSGTKGLFGTGMN